MASNPSSVQAEMTQLKHRPRPTDIRDLLQHARATVEQLAMQRSIRFRVKLPEEPAGISTDPMVAEQALVSVLSHAIQQARPGALDLALVSEAGQLTLILRYAPEPGEANIHIVDRMAMQLVGRLGWAVKQEDQPEGLCTVTVHMMARGPVILVIDDNKGLVKLVERYLADRVCRVVPAADGQEGLQLALELVPDAVVLDVMMPHMPGWEVLQRLRNDAQTAHIPVIICSVIKDPELAYSLGAALFLPKPISQQDILNALHQLGML
jgi:CheY-like chemotaxis protein